MERHHQHCFDHHHRRALGPWFQHRVTLPLANPWTAPCGSWVFFYPRNTRRTRKKILDKDYSKDFYLDFEPVRRSITKPFPKARYSSAFSVEIFVKDYIFSCLSARNLWRKSLIKIWPMARNQSSSEFRRNLDGNKIFNKNPWPKCARVPRFWGGFYFGSPTARHLNKNLKKNL